METTFGQMFSLARRLALLGQLYATATGRCHVCHVNPPSGHGFDPYRCTECAHALDTRIARITGRRHFQTV